MKTNLKIVAAVITLAGIQASAVCRNAQQQSEEAALKASNAQFKTSCQVLGSKNTMKWPAKGQEGWTVEVQCGQAPVRRVSVGFKQDANKVCAITRVKIQELDGSQCGLSDVYGGENEDWQFEPESQSLSLGTMKAQQLKALPVITQQQIIATVEDNSASNVVEAVAILKEGSEAGDVYLVNFSYKGMNYTSVHSYPGGNQVGLIFKQGSAKPFASNGDGSISCIDEK